MKNTRLFIVILVGITLVLAAVLAFVLLSRPAPAATGQTAVAPAERTAAPKTAAAQAAPTPTPACSLECDVTTDRYSFGISCETGPLTNEMSNSTSLEYDATGQVSKASVSVNQNLVYSDSGNSYHLSGVIVVQPAAGLVDYSVQATGGAFGDQPGVCKQGDIPVEEPAGTNPTEPPAAAAADLYIDDFSDPGSGWPVEKWDAGEIGYSGGKYQITVIPTNRFVWSYVEDSFADAVFSTETTLTAPTGEGDFGIICRLQDDDNFYALEVTENGYFTIWKHLSGETVYLLDWEYSASIPVNEAFTVKAGCVGSTLSLIVNDVLLATVQDDSFKQGKFGVIAGTDETGGFTVAFDNYKVYEP